MGRKALPTAGKERRGGKRTTSFKPGQTGNPRGLTKEQRKRRDDFGAFVRGKLCDLGLDGKPHIDAAIDAAIVAARGGSHADLELLLAYAYGRPLQRMESSVKADVRIKIKRNVRAPERPAPADADDHV